MRSKRAGKCSTIAIGFTADGSGRGVACLEMRHETAAHAGPTTQPAGAAAGADSRLLVRFTCSPLPLLHGRDIGYAALAAVARELLRCPLRSVTLCIDDERLALDLAERRTLPQALALPYVALRCLLNRLPAARVFGPDALTRELTLLAGAELHRTLAA